MSNSHSKKSMHSNEIPSAAATVAASTSSIDASSLNSRSQVASKPISLLTFNTYLFPIGLRHNLKYANKWARAIEILKEMRRHECTPECSPSPPPPTADSATVDQSNDFSASAASSNLTHRTKRTKHTPTASSATDLESTISEEERPLLDSSRSTACAASTLLSADIVCMQEVLGSLWCSQWKKHFQALAEPRSSTSSAASPSPSPSPSPDPSPLPPAQLSSLGEYELVFTPPASLCAGTFVDSGLLIASRFPVLHSTFHSFRNNPFLMRFCDKGWQHAVLDVSSRTSADLDSTTSTSSSPASPPRVLHVINTHLHPYEASWSVEHGQQVRRLQVQEIRDYLLSTTNDSSLPAHVRFSPTESALVMTGDLNTEQGSTECHALRTILDCPNISLISPYEPTMHNYHPFCNHLPEQTICGDYAMGNAHVHMSGGEIVRGAIHLSDHYPVKVQLELH